MKKSELIEISFGIRTEKYIPSEITKLLGIRPSHFFKKGDKWTSIATGETHTHFATVWDIRSTDKIRSYDLEDHAKYLLAKLEPKKSIIKSFCKDPCNYVDMRFWFQSDATGFALKHDTMKRLNDLCQQINISVLVHDGTRRTKKSRRAYFKEMVEKGRLDKSCLKRLAQVEKQERNK